MDTKLSTQDYYHHLNQMIYQMTHISYTHSIAYNFISTLIPHHQTAIQLTTILNEDNSTKELISTLLQTLTNTLTKLKTIPQSQLSTHPLERVIAYQCLLQRSMNTMFTRMSQIRLTNHPLSDYLSIMTPLLQGAIQMATLTLNYESNKELKIVLKDILFTYPSLLEKLKRNFD